MELQLIELHPRLMIRGHTRGVFPSTWLRLFQERGIQYVFNVALIPDEQLHRACQANQIGYEHVPLHDSQRQPIPPGVTDLARRVAQYLDTAVVLIHCDSGYNRSGLVALLALALYTGRPTAELVAKARVLRPKILKNPRFAQFVLEYQQ